MGRTQSNMASTRQLLAGFVFLSIFAFIKNQTTPPEGVNPGCMPPPDPLGNDGPRFCFSKNTTCRATRASNMNQFERRGQIYRIFRTRNWWYCGRACEPTTACAFWTYRPKTQQCYLLKSCCYSQRAGFQSGVAGACPI